MNKTPEDIVLVAALDWGIGHATRTVPIIRQLHSEGKKVILASAGAAKNFYEDYFPELLIIEKPAYNIKYYRYLPLTISILIQVPKILFAIYREHNWLNKIINEYKITRVVSDNCYGLWCNKIKSIFITHQLMVKCPGLLKWMEPFFHQCILFWIKNFNECQIPDYASEKSLSGDLSHKYILPKNAVFIGPLSRFDREAVIAKAPIYHSVVLLSGPEPQRSIFESKCEKLLQGSKNKSCIIRGKPGENISKKNTEEITWYNHLPDEELKSILLNAKKIVCRSGYSTLMDLAKLKLKALLVPTPGQTEQEYLAVFNSKNDQFEMKKQSKITLNDLINY